MKSKAQENEEWRDLLNTILNLRVPNDEMFEILFSDAVTPDQLSDGITFKQVAALQVVVKACAGDSRAMTELLDRLLGKPTQHIENVNIEASYADIITEFAALDQQEALAGTAIQIPNQEEKQAALLEDLGL